MARRRRFIEAEHPRWPAESPDSRGGEFREKGTGPVGWLAAVAERMGGSAGAPRVTRSEQVLDATGVEGLRRGDHVRVTAGWRVTGARDTLWRGGPFDVELNNSGKPERVRASRYHPAGWVFEGVLLNKDGTRKKNNPTRLFVVSDPADIRRLGLAPWQQQAMEEAARRRSTPLPEKAKGPAKASLKVRRAMDRAAATLPADLFDWRSTVAEPKGPKGARWIDLRIPELERRIATLEGIRRSRERELRNDFQSPYALGPRKLHGESEDDYVARHLAYWDTGSNGMELETARKDLKRIQKALREGPTSSTAHLFREADFQPASYKFEYDSRGTTLPSKELAAHLDTVLAAGKQLEEELQRILHNDHTWMKAERMLTDDGELSQAAVDRLFREGRVSEYNGLVERRQAAQRIQVSRRRALILEMLASIRGYGTEQHKDVVAARSGDMQLWNTEHQKYPDSWEHPPHPQFWDHIQAAMGYYPDDWVRLSSEHGELQVASRKRAHHRSSVKLLATARYDDTQWTNNGFPSSYEETNVHELAHRMETVIPGLRELEFAYVRRRATKSRLVERMKRLKNIFPNSGYDDYEWTFEDDWKDAYSGKSYESRGDRGASADRDPTRHPWELFSTGVEDLFGGTQRFDKTTGIQQFTLGVLALLARQQPAPARRRTPTSRRRS